MELTTSWEEKGRRAGEVNLVLRLLRRRCGHLPAAVEEQVSALPLERMENLAVSLLDFTSTADLERWFQNQ